MLDQKIRLDIRMVKFQDYIRRKPDRPFGYYGLGVIYMMSGKPGMADKMFTQALKLNPAYTPARIGKLEYLLQEKRFISAARYYHKHRSCLQKKTSQIRICRYTSNLYLSKDFYQHMKKMWSLFVFREGVGALQRMFNNGLENPIVNLLLAMFYLKEGSVDERARVFYHLCVDLEGIDNTFRWDLLQSLSKEQPFILSDERIAGMFSAIPESAYGKDYANFLLSQFIIQNDQQKILKSFSDLSRKHISIDKKTLWKYLAFCRENGLWNSSVYLCCQKLLNAGWIDNVLAHTLKELKERNLAENTKELEKLLSLYGY